MSANVKHLKICFFLIIIISIFAFFYSCKSSNLRSLERSLKLDRRPAPSEKTFVENIAKEIPYLPIEDLVNRQYKKRNFNRSCARYPSFLDVKIRNDYWQEYQNRNLSYYIYGAYFDNRPTVVKKEPLVRVLVMMNFIAKEYKEYPMTYCQLWYEEESKPFLTPMKRVHKIWNYQWGHSSKFHFAHFISCPVPAEHKDRIPRTVSLVAQPCDKATNNVRVTYMPLLPDEERKEFAVCIKGLDFPGIDVSHRIVEHFETLRSLGAEKITTYQQQVHPNTTKVLEYYRDTGYIDYLPMSLTTAISSLPNYRHLETEKNGWSYNLNEVISYNDCLYRNMYRYKYVAVIDTDELIMPLGNITNWHDLMSFLESTSKTKKCQQYSSYCFRCIHFPNIPGKPPYSTDIPEYFQLLQRVERIRQHVRPGAAIKCLHSTDYVIATHNHYSMQTAEGSCWFYSVPTNVGQMQHYREPIYKGILNDTVIDLSIWRMKDKIIEGSMKVFKILGFLSD